MSPQYATASDRLREFLAVGWTRFGPDPDLLDWIRHALPHAREAVADSGNANWLRCAGTWFVGANVLANDHQGRIGDSGPLCGEAVSFLRRHCDTPPFHWDRAQISVCYPGYPKSSPSESESSYRYRLHRDAAHVDGLHAEGPNRRRRLRERHAFVLGIPMTEFSCDAAPPVVWKSSHELVRSAFRELFSHTPHEKWPEVDVTDRYQALRRQIFERCPRQEIRIRPGECFLIHRLALHGIAPWGDGASAGPDGRMICYFRPGLCEPLDWLHAP
ncbi:MAG: hypothetical protein F4Z15_05265 [Gammaproteobacteria bacterium]|nr:hypothetical protein [Gammaproteobacteria bacterium]MYD76153.1 hypothetical protein [Gammaproteobacteria bacterium]MYJ51700.1 hypothetical protein [Gammaproteobacteria bacterium]